MTQNRPWTTGEIKVLEEFQHLGAEGLAQLLDRSVGSVNGKAHQLRLSLINNASDVIVTREVMAILVRLKASHRLPICPSCGSRIAIMKNSGMCRVCHLDKLIELRETQIQELARERKLVKLRQDKRRMRVCSNCGDAYFPRVTKKDELCSRCEDLV